nr:hypothetical protein [Treponema sp.]
MKFLRKKSVSFIVSLLAIGFSFLACDDDTEIDEYESLRGIRFPDYELFTEKKNAWNEPASYSFSYRFGLGDSMAPIVAHVSNGDVTVEDEESNAAETSTTGRFSSIAEIYEYFENCYENHSTLDDFLIGITYSATFLENSSYPTSLSVENHYVNSGDIDGHGGVDIKIFDVKIE